MIVSIRNINDFRVIKLEGKIIGEAEEFRSFCEELHVDGENVIVLDFSRVQWINSYGVGLLLSCLKTVRENGGDIYIVAVNHVMSAYFRVTRLDTVFEIYDRLDEVIDDLAFDKVSTSDHVDDGSSGLYEKEVCLVD
jgi:anti-sigma B factor antagonist